MYCTFCKNCTTLRKIIYVIFSFSWRCFYYVYSFLYGLVVLWDKPWLWDIKYCYYNYPYHPVTSDIWWYYMISMSFYWALSFSQFFDVKRKDFWQMFIHHIATISLMCFSWVGNLTRIGSLVLLCHDCADILLEVRIKGLKLLATVFRIFFNSYNLFLDSFRWQKWPSMQIIKNYVIIYLSYLQFFGLWHV